MHKMESRIVVSSVNIKNEGTISSTFHNTEKKVTTKKDVMNRNVKVSKNDDEVLDRDTPSINRELLIKERRKRGVLRKLLDADDARKADRQQYQQVKNITEDSPSFINKEKVSINNLINKESKRHNISNNTNDTLNSSINVSTNNIEKIMKETNFDEVTNNNINKPKLVNIFEDEKVKEEERIEKEIARKHLNIINSNINISELSKQTDSLQIIKNNFTISTTPRVNITKISTTSKSSTDFISGIGNLFSAFGKGIGKFIGFEKDCKNKGYKDGTGKCVCPPYHFGSYCEQVNCANGGRLIQTSRSSSRKFQCQCPNSEFITGEFCQYIKCLNGGTPIDGEGRCSCNNNWYSGNFCENYSTSWTIVFVIPIVILILVTFLCAICRLDLCPKRNAYVQENTTINSGRRRRRRGNLNENYSNNIVNRLPPLDEEERERMVTEHFLNQCRMQGYVSTSTSNVGHNLSNQNSLSNFLSLDDSVKILEPPPSYQEALSAISAPAIPPIDITTAPRPPAYQTIDPNRRRPSNT
ncbi:Epidermal growth factor-like domain-containing protein [Strongyloides ratti]|uniref:Epidermal growth factor-like domain-containing protein n=1 Tax=Strongyloides ratti TaxID=34506 RepID=A0A090LF68_STRRB|nr:Epidermal growth factor-like domain-containing protein [Strongyloides ratti]CEF68412.1 Epidermal growth factor-like domain-containing protein [Strongyloides ratti]